MFQSFIHIFQSFHTSRLSERISHSIRYSRLKLAQLGLQTSCKALNRWVNDTWKVMIISRFLPFFALRLSQPYSLSRYPSLSLFLSSFLRIQVEDRVKLSPLVFFWLWTDGTCTIEGGGGIVRKRSSHLLPIDVIFFFFACSFSFFFLLCLTSPNPYPPSHKCLQHFFSSSRAWPCFSLRRSMTLSSTFSRDTEDVFLSSF